MVMEGDLTWGGEHTIQYTVDVFQNCTPETYIIYYLRIPPKVNKNTKKMNKASKNK